MSKLDDVNYISSDESTDEEEQQEKQEETVKTESSRESDGEDTEGGVGERRSDTDTSKREWERIDDDETLKVNTRDFLSTFENFAERTKKKRKARKRKEKEKKEEETVTPKEAETEIRKLAKQFGAELTRSLRTFQRRWRDGLLTEDHIDELIELHNELRESTRDKISFVLDTLPRGEDVPADVYDWTNLYFDKQYARVERLISVN